MRTPLALRHAVASLTLFFALSLQACAGCEDVTPDPEDQGSTKPDLPDARDMDAGADLTASDMPRDMDPADASDMSRPPRRDMTLPGFDFGEPDQAQLPFAIEAVVPPSGPLEGGTLVRIKGTSIQEGTTVFFGNVSAEFDAVEGSLIGRTPPASSPGPVTLKAISPAGEVASLPNGFTYTTTLRLTSVTPSLLPTTGGVELEIRGAGFEPQTAIALGDRDALRVEVVSSSLIRAIAPPHAAGVVDLRATSPVGSATLEDAVTYFTPLTIDHVEPASGPLSGGGQATLYGQGFETGMQVRFGTQQAAVSLVQAQLGRATLVVPPGQTLGLTDISVTTSREVGLLKDAYLYVDQSAPALIATVRPTFGPLSGGAEVRLTGHALDDASLEVRFEGQPAAIIERAPTFLRVTTPPGTSPGPVDVTLLATGNERSRLVDAYTYLPDLALDTLSPTSGPVEGGTEVTLRGEGLDTVTRLSFGGVRAQILSQSADTLNARSPAHTAGLVDVHVEAAGGLTATLEEAFTYTEPLQIWGFSPTRGAIAGGTYVRVRGQGFQGSLSATLGATPATLLRRIDRNNLYLYSPPGAPGEVELALSNGTSRVTGPYPFLYFTPASRFGGASGGDVSGAVNVSVLENSGAPIAGAFVMLSTRPDTRYQGRTDINGMITLSGPDVFGAQTVTGTAAGYATVTTQSIDAENITLILTKVDPQPGGGSGDPPPFGTLRGRLTSVRKLADPSDESSYDMAIVGTTSVSPAGGNPNPGPGSIVLGSGPYQINSRIGDLAVIALCGVYNEDSGVFDPQYLAVERFVVVSDKGVYDIDLVCDVPLDQNLSVKLVNPIYAPDGPTSNRAQASWNFGFEGYFPAPVVVDSLESVLTLGRQPSLTGALSDVTLDVFAGSFTQGFAPYSQTSRRGVNSYANVLSMPPLLDVPEPISPQPNGVITGSRISWEAAGPYLPDMYIVMLRNESGLPVWIMTVPGDETSVQLPEFPDFSAIPIADRPAPYAEGQLFMSITAVRIPGFRYEAFTYQDLISDRWEAYALNRWAVSFP